MTITSLDLQGKTTHSEPGDPISLIEAEGSVASPLSFSRAALRALLSQPCNLEKLTVDLDERGRGEILYRFTVSHRAFYFFLISQELPEEQKLDRNFAASWDAMGVLCEGTWTARRQAYLRSQIPLQRSGRADYDTLVYARGNRSGRLFASVVDALAAGRQPDAGKLASVGYIMRTTAFIGNGALGTKPLAAFAQDHPLRPPYHAQMIAGFLLREFNFDLVDAMAARRAPNAARLALPLRRFLGLGNSAATGLVPFLYGHPTLIGDWIGSRRRALDSFLMEKTTAGQVDRFRELLSGAIGHLRESARPDDGVFMPDCEVANSLAAILQRVTDDAPDWRRLRERMLASAPPQAIAIVDALLLELASGCVHANAWLNHVDERLYVGPGISTKAFLAMLRGRYAWALAAAAEPGARRYFWYRASGAPRDLRRGIRGRVPSVEFETPMDWVIALSDLARALDPAPNQALSDFLLVHPEFSAVAARAHTLASIPTGELAINPCTADFEPFGAIRQVLALFGLDKLEAALPKSVRGTFFQGAPIAEDLDAHFEADWPYPRIPSREQIAAAPALPSIQFPKYDSPPDPAQDIVGDGSVVASPVEMERNLAAVMQASGLPLGRALQAAPLALDAIARRMDCFPELIAELTGPVANWKALPVLHGSREEAALRLDAGGAHPLAVLTAAQDIARDRAARHEAGAVLVTGMGSGVVVKEIIEAMHEDPYTLAACGACQDRFRAAIADLPAPFHDLVSQWDSADVGRSAVVLCLSPARAEKLSAGGKMALNTFHLAYRRRMGRILNKGIRMSAADLALVESQAARLFILPEIEVRLRDEPIDPLKMF